MRYFCPRFENHIYVCCLCHAVSLVRSFSTQHASSFLDPRLVFTFVASRCLNAVFSTAAVSLDLSLCVAFLRVYSPILLLVPIRAHVYGYVHVFCGCRYLMFHPLFGSSFFHPFYAVLLWLYFSIPCFIYWKCSW